MRKKRTAVSFRCSSTVWSCSSLEMSTDANDIRRFFAECAPANAPNDERLLPVDDSVEKHSFDAFPPASPLVYIQ
jgi:hypothetical protein